MIPRGRIPGFFSRPHRMPQRKKCCAVSAVDAPEVVIGAIFSHTSDAAAPGEYSVSVELLLPEYRCCRSSNNFHRRRRDIPTWCRYALYQFLFAKLFYRNLLRNHISKFSVRGSPSTWDNALRPKHNIGRKNLIQILLFPRFRWRSDIQLLVQR